MRKASGFPAQTASLLPVGSAGRLSLPAEPTGLVRVEALGKAKPFRTSGGRAALGCYISGTLTRPWGRARISLRMLSATSQEVYGVGEKLNNARERLAGAAWAARQIHDKLVVPCSHNPSGERRPGSFLHAFGPHQFRKTRDFLIDDRARSLRGDVARSKPSAAGGEDGITIITLRPGQKRDPNAVRIVRQDLERLDQPASLFKQLANRRAGPVLPAANRCSITQHENSCAKGKGHK